MARVQLQATLVNELVDLDDATANLVVGVPTFAFREIVDPMALQETVARLGTCFDSQSASGYALSNAIMSQAAGTEDSRLRDENLRRSSPAPALRPEIAGSESDEDLFVFTVKGVTLKKGERMVLPVADYELAYRDVYVLDLPFAPPMEVRANANEAQQREIGRLLGAPRFTHVLRLANSAPEPLTTAPALIASGDRVLGQGLMSYTARGAECDLALTTAVDIKVTKHDRETGRAPGALTVGGSSYLRVDLQGSIAITNRRADRGGQGPRPPTRGTTSGGEGLCIHDHGASWRLLLPRRGAGATNPPASARRVERVPSASLVRYAALRHSSHCTMKAETGA